MMGHHLTYPLVPAAIQHNYHQTKLTGESRLMLQLIIIDKPAVDMMTRDCSSIVAPALQVKK